MSDETRKPLDLDELFGQAKAVKVKWQGKEYELLKMEAIGPRQAVKFQRMQLRAGKLQNLDPKNFTDEKAKELESLFDDMLKVLCKDLPLETLNFNMKSRILVFYVEETQGKKALETAMTKNLTGAMSSAK